MKKILKIIAIFTMVFSITSCSEDYLDVNTDPNNPVSVTPNLLLPVAQRYTAYTITQPGNPRRTNTLGNMLMQNWSQTDGYSWYQDEFLYNVNTTFYSSIWNYSYQNTLKQYHTFDVPTANYEYYRAISKIMKSFHFQILVDSYGDIPYTQALQRGSLLNPKFDDAQTVYEGLITELDNAIANINAGAANANVIKPGSADVMFAGDMTKWKQLANTIKLRILARQSSMSERVAYINAELAKIATEGSGFITADVTLNPGYAKQNDQQNPFWNCYGKGTDDQYVNTYKATCATQHVIDKLTNTNDPRIDYIYEKPSTGHLGVVQGLDPYPANTFTEPLVSNIGPGLLKSPEQASVIFTLAESEFIKAELAQRAGISFAGDAKAYYENGIKASFNYLGVSTTSASTYIAQSTNLVSWTGSTNKIEAIMTQKWIALNGIDAIQSWFDYNRTGFPVTPLSLKASGANIPVRLMYPDTERSNNPNTPAQLDIFSNKIFWAN